MGVVVGVGVARAAAGDGCGWQDVVSATQEAVDSIS